MLSGETEYLLRIVVPNLSAYDSVYKKLIQSADLFDVNFSFATGEIKCTTALPLNYAN